MKISLINVFFYYLISSEVQLEINLCESNFYKQCGNPKVWRFIHPSFAKIWGDRLTE